MTRTFPFKESMHECILYKKILRPVMVSVLSEDWGPSSEEISAQMQRVAREITPSLANFFPLIFSQCCFPRSLKAILHLHFFPTVSPIRGSRSAELTCQQNHSFFPSNKRQTLPLKQQLLATFKYIFSSLHQVRGLSSSTSTRRWKYTASQ